MNKFIFTSWMIVVLALSARAEAWSNRITVTVRGKGPEVMLIPGLACSNAVWEATAKRLEGRYRLHLVQVAGFAGSPARGNAKGAIVQPTVEAIDAYIKANKLKAPTVIGHSLGGFMGLILAAQHPEDEGKLMIVDAFPFFSVIMGAKDADAAIPQATAMRDMILTGTQEDFARGEEDFLKTMVKSPAGLKAATQWGVTSDKTVVARTLYEVMTTDMRSKLAGIKTPVTMVYPWDAATGYTKEATDGFYKDSYGALKNKTMVRVDDSLHFIMLDQPEAFAGKVEAFLK